MDKFDAFNALEEGKAVADWFIEEYTRILIVMKALPAGDIVKVEPCRTTDGVPILIVTYINPDTRSLYRYSYDLELIGKTDDELREISNKQAVVRTERVVAQLRDRIERRTKSYNEEIAEMQAQIDNLYASLG